MQQLWQQLQQGFQSAQGVSPQPDLATMFKGPQADVMAQFSRIQGEYVSAVKSLLESGFSGKPVQTIADKRFAGDAWAGNAAFANLAQLYLLNSKTMLQMADALPGDTKTKARVRFAVEQAIAAANPANSLALNPEAQKLALESKGQSIAKGIQNLLADAKQGHMSQTDESLFEVGRNVATSVGAVVFENDFFQLIEYKPSTPKVFENPFLIIPPCINKFYILDLQPANSLVAHAVAQGHRTFVLSWRNPTPADAELHTATWDDYIEHAGIAAINAVRKLCKAPQINALGFCVGGTILATSLAVLAARAKVGSLPEVASATLLTTLLDFSDTGVLDLFIDESFVQYREAQLAKGGLLKGQELASTFSFLRPNELVWNYVQGNYLQGKTPPPFDLLFWNADSTNLPGPMYAWYLRNTYLENKLCKPGQATVCGQAVDLRKLTLPVYVYGSREDHIVPITGAYASLRHLGGPTRFVMGASGHIAGVINPPAANKRSHWLGVQTKGGVDARHPATHAQWLQTAREQPGSWWTDWSQWLAIQGGALRPAPKAYSAKGIEAAPGRYVKQRA